MTSLPEIGSLMGWPFLCLGRASLGSTADLLNWSSFFFVSSQKLLSKTIRSTDIPAGEQTMKSHQGRLVMADAPYT